MNFCPREEVKSYDVRSTDGRMRGVCVPFVCIRRGQSCCRGSDESYKKKKHKKNLKNAVVPSSARRWRAAGRPRQMNFKQICGEAQHHKY